ncbi:MAG: hypothetical protein KAS38_02135, partial [Anaerolineales bacterium]|nr:hypothetical protein [Anaerolineales bacterium]
EILFIDQIWGAWSPTVGGAELFFRCKISKGIGTIAFFCVIPIIWTIVQSTNISWAILGPFILIALGIIMLVNVFFLKKEGEKPELGV